MSLRRLWSALPDRNIDFGLAARRLRPGAAIMSAAAPANPAAAFYATPVARLVGAHAAVRASLVARPGDPARAAAVLHPASGKAARPGQGRARAVVGDAPPLRRRRADHLAAARHLARQASHPAGPRLGRRRTAVAAARRPPGRGRIRSGAGRPARPRPQRRRPKHPAAMGSRPLRRERPPGALARRRRPFAGCPRVGPRRGARPVRRSGWRWSRLRRRRASSCAGLPACWDPAKRSPSACRTGSSDTKACRWSSSSPLGWARG